MKRTFDNRQQVLNHLKAMGFKIGKTKLYQDADAGKLIMEPDGTVRQESVDRYIKIAELPQPAMMTVDAANKLDQKTAEEIRQLKLRNEKLQHELDVLHGKYVPKSEADADAATLAALLDAVPRHTLMLNLPRYLSAIGADTTKAKMFFQLFDADLTREINAICDDGTADVIGGEEGWPHAE